MKTFLFSVCAVSMSACVADYTDRDADNDSDAVSSDEQSIIGGTTDNGDRHFSRQRYLSALN